MDEYAIYSFPYAAEDFGVNADTFWRALEEEPLDWAGYAAFSDWTLENGGPEELAYTLGWMARNRHAPLRYKEPPRWWGTTKGKPFWYWVSRMKRPTEFRKEVLEARPEAGLHARLFLVRPPGRHFVPTYQERNLYGFREFQTAVLWLSGRVNLLREMLEIPLR